MGDWVSRRSLLVDMIPTKTAALHLHLRSLHLRSFHLRSLHLRTSTSAPPPPYFGLISPEILTLVYLTRPVVRTQYSRTYCTASSTFTALQMLLGESFNYLYIVSCWSLKWIGLDRTESDLIGLVVVYQMRQISLFCPMLQTPGELDLVGEENQT